MGRARRKVSNDAPFRTCQGQRVGVHPGFTVAAKVMLPHHRSYDSMPLFGSGYRLIVVETALRNEHRSCLDAIHQAVLVGDAPGPIPGPFVAQGFRLANADERVILDVGNQPIDTGQEATISLLPIIAVLPRLRGPVDLELRRPGASAGQAPPRSRRARLAGVARWLAPSSGASFPNASEQIAAALPRQARRRLDSTRRQSCSIAAPARAAGLMWYS